MVGYTGAVHPWNAPWCSSLVTCLAGKMVRLQSPLTEKLYLHILQIVHRSTLLCYTSSYFGKTFRTQKHNLHSKIVCENLGDENKKSLSNSE